MNASCQTPTARLRPPAPALACVATAAAISAFPAEPVLALDLDNNADLITETLASRERWRDWDPARRYGARPVSEADRGFATPEGVRVGNFFFFPSVSETAIYDSNIFGLAKEPVADWRFVTTPSLSVTSQMPRHALDATIYSRFMNFAENSDQDYVNFGGLVRGALHIDHAHTLSASLQSSREHEERTASTADRDAAEPVPIDRSRASVGITRDSGRLYGTLAATAEQWDYGAVDALDGSRLDQDFRDQTLYSAHLRTGYRFSPGYEFVTKLRTLRQLNDGRSDIEGGGNNDSTGYEAMFGLAFESNPLFRWRLLGGYGLRDYDNTQLASVESSLMEAQLQWLPTERMTIFANAGRSLVDEIGASDNGRIETTVGGRVEYELRHDLAGNVHASLSDLEFLGSDRQDRVLEIGAGLDYHYSKNFLFTLGYTFEQRDSNEADFDLDRSQVRVGGKLKF